MTIKSLHVRYAGQSRKTQERLNVRGLKKSKYARKGGSLPSCPEIMKSGICSI